MFEAGEVSVSVSVSLLRAGIPRLVLVNSASPGTLDCLCEASLQVEAS